MNIEISIDHVEGAEFVAWLIRRGHTAQVGNTTGNYVDGVWASSDADANATLTNLWDQYCGGAE